MRFNPEGDCIASGSHDKSIFLWRTYGDCENYAVLKGGCKPCLLSNFVVAVLGLGNDMWGVGCLLGCWQPRQWQMAAVAGEQGLGAPGLHALHLCPPSCC